MVLSNENAIIINNFCELKEKEKETDRVKNIELNWSIDYLDKSSWLRSSFTLAIYSNALFTIREWKRNIIEKKTKVIQEEKKE